MRTLEGVRLGAEEWCWTARGSPPATGNSAWLTAAARAIVKLVLARRSTPPAPAPARTRACTRTSSPARNGRLGMKLSPVPVEYARSTPPCGPLLDPATCTAETRVPGAPRKLIWVFGEASGVPGSGDSASGLAAAEEAL